MKRVAVVLSGCGYKDGSEITEAVSTLIALSESGAQYEIFAPDMTITAKNHRTNQLQENRSVLDEAARIARGKISDIKSLQEKNFDALIFPGGFGAALHLCTFGTEGAKGTVLPDVRRIIESFHHESKPIGGICIAPALLALTLGRGGITVTVGDDADTIKEILKTGASHESCSVTDFITDRENKIITTPAYMYDDAKPCEIYKGVSLAIRELVEMA